MFSELKIKETDYGLRISLKANVLTLTIAFVNEKLNPLFLKLKKTKGDNWGVLLDIKDLQSISRDPLHALRYAHLMAMVYGAGRGAILYGESFSYLNNKLARNLFPDTKGGLRYIFCESYHYEEVAMAYEEKAISWIRDGIEP